MDNKEKVISLYKYIQQLYRQRYQVVVDIENQQWIKYLSNIVFFEDYVELNYMDRTSDDDETETGDNIILQIKKPEFEIHPSLPQSLNGWVKDGWDKYESELDIIKSKYIDEADGTKDLLTTGRQLFFDEASDRVRDLKEFRKDRNVWAQRQKTINTVRKMFNDLHLKYVDLDRDSETIEMMIGQGILKCEISNRTVNHPILLKKVRLELDALNNIIKIIDSGSDPELSTMLLQEIDFIDHSSIKKASEELQYNFYHPLDRNDTPDFLKVMIHRLHPDSKYCTSEEKSVYGERIIIYDNPVFFIRKKVSGVEKAIEEIINQILETGDIPGPLLNLIGESISQMDEPNDELSVSESLSEVSGEDVDILLSKEANREQLEIAKRIEKYNAVLVQGPPGTGKTHTIANLMGHFLAQGKNVLVTSHTKKALSVVKDKIVPELQSLCVSMLDDNSKDMERSIDGITEYISSHSSLELSENSQKLISKRNMILRDLKEVRKKIYDIKFKEFETIVFGGSSFTVADAAKYVYENKEELYYIPGKVTLGKPLPATRTDLELLYKTNDLVSKKDEIELELRLPDPSTLPTPAEFKDLVLNEQKRIREIVEICNIIPEHLTFDEQNSELFVCGNAISSEIRYDILEEIRNYISKNVITTDKWCKNAILDGKRGGGYKEAWQSLIECIEGTNELASSSVMLLLGNKIDFDEKNISCDIIGTLRSIKEHLFSGKKMGSFTFLWGHKGWKEMYQSIKINGKCIENVNDCDILISWFELKYRREKLSVLWNNLVESNGGISFLSFENPPEQFAASYVSKLHNCINWYDVIFKETKRLIESANLNDTIIDGKREYSNASEEIDADIQSVYTTLPLVVDAILVLNSKLKPILNKYQGAETILSNESSSESNVCKTLLVSVTNRNIEEYSSCYYLLSELFDKYYYINERNRILHDIGRFAPEWMESIKKRVGIHGEGNVPNNIDGAWKWKQFAGEIESITAMPFEMLQKKSVDLSREFRGVTTELAENLAWYHLLERIEKDITQKQDLQGWKQTVRKIGKGTGKKAPALRREAQKLMAKCQRAVPAWVMPINKALESLDPKTNKFDVVIIDEASQSDISALAIMYLARKIIIVGDDEQVSPSSVGIDVEKMENLAKMYIKGVIPNAHLYDMNSSLYDIAKTTFPILMLKEHFRCVSDIIGYSNRLSYDFKIKPLRDDSTIKVKPPTVSYRVNGGHRSSRKTNKEEAEMIVALMLACMECPEYDNMTFGVISLVGDDQANRIKNLAAEKINPLNFEKRRILCGNASHFQGDERDVMFLSLVDNNEADGPLRMTGEGAWKSTKQRYNVAVSRAKNQLWVIHSLDVAKDLKPGDMRRDLIEYSMNPSNFKEQMIEVEAKADSVFEIAVAKALLVRGFHIVQQWKVGAYRIDMVAIYGEGKVAIECDGERYHSGDEKIREDMERQVLLERLGWRFIRLRGSEYFSDPERAINRIVDDLYRLGIEPETSEIINSDANELKDSVIIRAEQIMAEWDENNYEENEIAEETINKVESVDSLIAYCRSL